MDGMESTEFRAFQCQFRATLPALFDDLVGGVGQGFGHGGKGRARTLGTTMVP